MENEIKNMENEIGANPIKKELKIKLSETPILFINIMSVILIIFGVGGAIAMMCLNMEILPKAILASICLIVNLAFGALLSGISYIVKSNAIQRKINAEKYDITLIENITLR